MQKFQTREGSPDIAIVMKILAVLSVIGGLILWFTVNFVWVIYGLVGGALYFAIAEVLTYLEHIRGYTEDAARKLYEISDSSNKDT